LRVHVEYPVQKIGPAVQHAFGLDEVLAAAALDHVAGERERAACKSEQRHAAVERAFDRDHCIEDVVQACQVGDGQAVDCGFVHERFAEARTFSLCKMQAQTHRIGYGKDVRKQYRRVERKSGQRLQRHLRREIGRGA
jgi:hypothetical protein